MFLQALLAPYDVGANTALEGGPDGPGQVGRPQHFSLQLGRLLALLGIRSQNGVNIMRTLARSYVTVKVLAGLFLYVLKEYKYICNRAVVQHCHAK
jgi:hypothetical protein